MSMSTGRPCCKAQRRLAIACGDVPVNAVESEIGTGDEESTGNEGDSVASRSNGTTTEKKGATDFESSTLE